jgi:hypothetical protein
MYSYFSAISTALSTHLVGLSKSNMPAECIGLLDEATAYIVLFDQLYTLNHSLLQRIVDDSSTLQRCPASFLDVPVESNLAKYRNSIPRIPDLADRDVQHLAASVNSVISEEVFVFRYLQGKIR